jgi:hypothetical protein
MRRFTPHPRPRIVVALLAALHPLLLYYSQEARMYTLLTMLGVLAAYCLLRSTESRKPAFLLCGYLLTATAAIYTHYFAFFLLVALAIAYLLYHVQQGHDSLRPTWQAVQPFLLSNLLILLLYLPWLRAMLTRFRIDASYWQGDFKVLEGLHHIALSFTSGETVRQTAATWLLIPFTVLTLLALVFALRARPKKIAKLPYALLWSAMPVVGVLVLATVAPKFNARYTMIALPGMLLLWSIGLTQWASNPGMTAGAGDDGDKQGRQRLLASISLLFVVCSWLYADWNWFFNPAFTKDQWREVTSFLRTRLQPQETVILVSGHAWPVWRYYAPDLPLVRLPELDVLNVNAVLDYANTAPALRKAFAANTGKSGAWLVEWQDEVVDPTGVTPTQLELGGREKGQSATFWGLTLRRFSRIKPERLVDQPPLDESLHVNFGNQLILLGYHLMENGDLLLFWQRDPAAQIGNADYQITGQTHTASGVVIAQVPDQRPANYNYPVNRWRPGEIVTGHIPASQWLGTTPQLGTYTLQLGVYTLADGKPHPLLAPTGQPFHTLTITVVAFD